MFSLQSLAPHRYSSSLSSSSSLDSLSSIDDDELEVKLLYGFAQERPDHIEKSHENYFYIDNLNDALGITIDELTDSNKIKEIKQGITVTPDHVDNLKAQLSFDMSDFNARYILQNWANHLQENFSKISLSNSLKNKDTNAFRFEFFNKNINLESDTGIQQTLNKHNLEEKFGKHYGKIISKFKSSDEEGFAFLNSVYSRSCKYSRDNSEDLGLLYSAMADLFINAFFRKTSKAGLDWVFGNNSPVQGIDFLSYSQNKAFSEDDLSKNNYKNTSHFNSKQRRPITFSELRHAQRHNYKINKITSAIRSTSQQSRNPLANLNPLGRALP